eukprot:4034748-Alexandrium_andersonii.AAC.1
MCIRDSPFRTLTKCPLNLAWLGLFVLKPSPISEWCRTNSESAAMSAVLPEPVGPPVPLEPFGQPEPEPSAGSAE